jgi:hypothetical protein
MLKWRALLAAGVLCTALVACSDDSPSSESVAVGDAPAVSTDATAAAADTTATPSTDAPTTDAPTTTVTPELWSRVVAPADCMCSDGSGFSFFVHRGDPAKVVFFLEGGGACFDVSTCGPDSDAFKRTVGDTLDASTGIFDFENPDNPFTDWSVVYVPYCTGDVHLGNQTMDYGDGVVIQHKGYVNGRTALNAMRDLFPALEELVVTGESAGSIPTPLYAGMARDLFATASIKVLADGSGAYPDIPVINATIGANWGTMNAVPPWPENEGMTPEKWSLPGLFVQAHAHAPDIVFSRHDFAFDQTQEFFASLAGIPADRLIELIDRNETQIEASGMDLFSYISPGDDHTILGKPEFYTHTVNDVTLLQWVTDLVNGTPIADVHCTECTTA